MALTTRVWGAGKLLLLGGALLLTYVVFAAARDAGGAEDPRRRRPGAAGKTVNDATALLAEAGLNLKVEEGRRVDPKVPAGQILARTRRPACSTRRERSVKVWVSAGPRSTIVPALLGESERTGAAARCSRRARAGVDGRDPIGRLPVRTRSSRRRRRRRAMRPRVALLVNRGERGATYVMPDLIGVNGDRAADLLRVARASASRWSAITRIPASRRDRAAAEPAGRLPDFARRADFARGQPVRRVHC